MKKIYLSLIVFIILISLFGCGENNEVKKLLRHPVLLNHTLGSIMIMYIKILKKLDLKM